MKVIIIGASGMVGSGALRECLNAPEVTSVRAIGRSLLNMEHEKLTQSAFPDFADHPENIPAALLEDIDACFFCLGATAAGMSEEQYAKLTYELTLKFASRLCDYSPNATFIYVSGAGADSTERSNTMWARVRGKTENALLKLPFKQVHIFRPAIIQPLHGAQSKTTSYRYFYNLLGPVLTIARHFFPSKVLSTEIIGQAMLSISRFGTTVKVLDPPDIYAQAKLLHAK
jgi:uncharacterized protein YbjT (DUF2867 family)